MTIKILITGGTFDKTYNEITGELSFKNTHVNEMLHVGRANVDVKVRTLMMIDSMELTDSHREIILKKCENSKEDMIIITHGTDTMAETARYLGERIHDKTVVLTGALIPYAFGSSDGFFNLGSAIAYVQALPKGVYIAMNGKYFTYDNVRKNKSTGNFETIKNE